MKKAIAIFAAIALSVSIFTACGNTQAAQTEAVSEAAAETTVAEEASARVTISGTKFMVGDKELWFNGVNTPWQNWNDFNGSMDAAAWEDTFKELQAEHINVTRIWVNCNGLGIVRLKTTGEFQAVNDKHWENLDTLFQLAEKYDIYVMPTILSFDHFKQTNAGYDKWRAMITSKENADSFANGYVAEFAKRFGKYEHIFAVDLMNEPDWVHENDECGKLDWDSLSYFFGKCASVIHENSDMLVTTGLGMIKYNSTEYDSNVISDENLKKLTGLDNSNMDFYSPHYYMWEKQWYGFPFDKSPEDFGLDGTKPCIIGECENDETQSGLTLTEKYQNCYNNGWNGVMVWMEYRTDGTSGCDSLWYRYDLTSEATNAMYAQIPEKIYPNAQ